MKCPRRIYHLIVDGCVVREGGWSTVQAIAKHLADTGIDVVIRMVPDEE